MILKINKEKKNKEKERKKKRKRKEKEKKRGMNWEGRSSTVNQTLTNGLYFCRPSPRSGRRRTRREKCYFFSKIKSVTRPCKRNSNSTARNASNRQKIFS